MCEFDPCIARDNLSRGADGVYAPARGLPNPTHFFGNTRGLPLYHSLSVQRF